MDIPRPENFNEVYLYEGMWLIYTYTATKVTDFHYDRN